MPLIAYSPLPTFERLRQEGVAVIDAADVNQQEVRELHIGLLNLMPDAALEATERQFFRLIGDCNQIAQFHLHPFTVPTLQRGPEAQAHIDQFYKSFDQIKEDGLDALIVTGANITGRELSEQNFWSALIEVLDWATENVTSVLCSCLATHAVMEFRYQQKRRYLGYKRWGVYSHQVIDRSHPLVSDVNTKFDVPHSRYNDISQAEFEEAGLRVLVASAHAGVHLAVSADGFRLVLFQGHPEYDSISLLKEYKRELKRWWTGERADYPPSPDHYFSATSLGILAEYRERVEAAKAANLALPDFPEALLLPGLNATWHDTAEAVLNNWVGKVFQLTNADRHKPFMDHIDPQNPLGR